MSPAAVLSLDVMKALDQREWPFLWSVLGMMGVGAPFVDMIKVLYNNPTAMVLTGNNSSPLFAMSRGLRQGCPLNPSLFTLSLETVTCVVPGLY